MSIERRRPEIEHAVDIELFERVRPVAAETRHVARRRPLHRLQDIAAERSPADGVERDRRAGLVDRVGQSLAEILVIAVEHVRRADGTQQRRLLGGPHDVHQRDAVGQADLLQHLPEIGGGGAPHDELQPLRVGHVQTALYLRHARSRADDARSTCAWFSMERFGVAAHAVSARRRGADCLTSSSTRHRRTDDDVRQPLHPHDRTGRGARSGQSACVRTQDDGREISDRPRARQACGAGAPASTENLTGRRRGACAWFSRRLHCASACINLAEVNPCGERKMRRTFIITMCAAMAAATAPTRAADDPAISNDRQAEGQLADNARWRATVPPHWNGTLLLWRHGYGGALPASADDAPPAHRAKLLAAGYALAGSTYAEPGWAIRSAVPDQLDTVTAFTQRFGKPKRVIAWGMSMGGLVTTAIVERAPARVDAGLALCGLIGGAVGMMNMALDGAYAFRTLVAPDAGIRLVGTGDDRENAARVNVALAAAQATAQGRARVGLAAVLAGLPGWTSATGPQPGADDYVAQEAEMAKTFTMGE